MRNQQFPVQNPGADRRQHRAGAGLGPGRTTGARAGADDRHRLVAEDVVRKGRDAQFSAFFNWPGMAPLYSGVAMSTAPARPMAARSACTAGPASFSASSLNGGIDARSSQTASWAPAGATAAASASSAVL